MSRIIEAKAVISAADKTGSVLDKIASKFKGLEKNAKAMEGIKPLKFSGNWEEELRRLKLTEKELQGVRKAHQQLHSQLLSDSVGRRPSMYFRAMDDWRDRTVSHWRAVKVAQEDAAKSADKIRSRFMGGAAAAARFGLIAAGVGGAAYVAGRAVKAGVKANAEGQRESARDYLAGLTPEESKRIEDASVEASRKYQSIDSQTMHERLRDTAMSTRSMSTALEMTDTIGQMTTVLQSLKGKDKAIEEGRKFFAALDVLGKNVDPKEIKELAEGYTKAVGVEGADMDLRGVLTMARRMKSAGATVSNRFLMTTAAGLGRDMGDERAGNAIAMMMQQEAQATKQAKAYGQKYGLRDANGKFVDRSAMMRDPDYWAWKNVTAAMQRAKLDPNKAEDVNTFLQSAYSNSSARDIISKLMTQKEQYQGKALQYDKAPGLADAAAKLPVKDPFVAYEAVLAQLRTLAGQAPAMDSAAQGLNALSGAIARLNGTVKDGGGWMKSASDSVKNWWEGEKRDAEAIGGVAKKVLEWDKKTGVNVGWTVPSWLRARPETSYPAGEDPMGADYRAKQFRSKEYWEGLGREGASAESAARLRREQLQWPTTRPFAVPGLSETMKYGTGVDGDKSVAVHGDMHGEAELQLTFNAGTELVTIVEQAKQVIRMAGQISSNGVGSTGKSSPDAAAPVMSAQPTAP